MYDRKPRNYVPPGLASHPFQLHIQPRHGRRHGDGVTILCGGSERDLDPEKLPRKIGKAFNHVKNLIHKHFCKPIQSVSQSAEEIVFVFCGSNHNEGRTCRACFHKCCFFFASLTSWTGTSRTDITIMYESRMLHDRF